MSFISDSEETSSSSSGSEAVARVAGEDKEAVEDKEATMESDDDAVGQSTSESDASAAGEGDGDAASSSSDVTKMEDSDAEQVCDVSLSLFEASLVLNLIL